MNWFSIFQMTYQTLLMTLISTFVAYLIGIPLGIILNITSKNGISPNRPVNLILGIFVNILRSIPCLILVVICMPFTRAIFKMGTGEWYTILVPLIICSFGFIARLVEQSLNEIPVGEIEAIRSLGATNWQIVYKVLLPEAKSSIISGVAVASVSILGYTSFAYNIGAGGLISGIWSLYAKHTADWYSQLLFWILLVIVIILVQGLQELGLLISRKIDKRRVLK